MSTITCGEHHIHFLTCKTCQALAQFFMSQRAGSTVTKKKQEAARKNGKKGGRPKKS